MEVLAVPPVARELDRARQALDDRHVGQCQQDRGSGDDLPAPAAATQDDPGLDANTTYTYQVSAVDAAGNVYVAGVESWITDVTNGAALFTRSAPATDHARARLDRPAAAVLRAWRPAGPATQPWRGAPRQA